MLRAACLGVGVVAVVMACGGSKSPPPEQPTVVSNTAPEPPPPPPPDAASATSTERAMALMREFMEAMCACSDSACAKSVSDRMVEWAQQEAAANHEPVTLTDAEQQEATELGTRMSECMQRAMGASGGP